MTEKLTDKRQTRDERHEDASNFEKKKMAPSFNDVQSSRRTDGNSRYRE